MFNTFENLKVWQMGREFRNGIYKISKKFPRSELYNLTNQIRRASLSITSNIVEGYGRYHYQENIQFCRVSRGSINEVLDQLYLALDNEYISQKEFEIIYKKGRELEQVLNGYISFLERKLKK